MQEVAEQNLDQDEQQKQVATLEVDDFNYLLDIPSHWLTEKKELWVDEAVRCYSIKKIVQTTPSVYKRTELLRKSPS